MNNIKPHELKLIGIDALRFVLSLSVIIWHYQHFYKPFNVKTELFTPQQPFYHILSPFYLQGGRAVQMFWVISGIIFFKVYYKAIESKAITFKRFAINRLTRLYPLHFLTLMIVALLQVWYYRIYKESFVYTPNDLKHFILNIFFVQNWFTYHSTFNGPSWSVSVELLIYVSYFILCSTKVMKSTIVNILIIVIFFTLDNLNWGIGPLNQCFYFFFTGCLLSRAISDNVINVKKWIILIVSYLIVFFLIKHIIQIIYHTDPNLYISGFIVNFNYILIYVSAIYSIILLFNHKVFDKVNLKFFTILGNLTYSMYLIHFSIQIVIFIILKPAGYAVFNSRMVFLAFIIVTVILGYIIFYYFERPVQNKLRKVLL